MLPVGFTIAATALNLCATAVYAFATLQGRTRPNRVSWLIWSFAPLIATAAQISSGVGLTSIFVFACGFGPLIVFLCSFANKQAYWHIDRLDCVCGALAIGGLIIWQLTSNADLAIFFSIMADFLAALPTLRKAVSTPESENGLAWSINVVASGLAVVSVQILNFTALSFSLYIFCIDCAICLAVNRRRLAALWARPA